MDSGGPAGAVFQQIAILLCRPTADEREAPTHPLFGVCSVGFFERDDVKSYGSPRRARSPDGRTSRAQSERFQSGVGVETCGRGTKEDRSTRS